jgi:hypothetical protein
MLRALAWIIIVSAAFVFVQADVARIHVVYMVG